MGVYSPLKKVKFFIYRAILLKFEMQYFQLLAKIIKIEI